MSVENINMNEDNNAKNTEISSEGETNKAFQNDEPQTDVVEKQTDVENSRRSSSDTHSQKVATVLEDMSLKKEKRMIIKNILIISIAFLFLFTAYNSMANLQSSINKQMGTASLSTLYAALVISCLFLPSLLIDKLKEKNTIAISMLGYSTYIAAQFYPEYYTLIPTAVLLGLGAAPMWSAKCTYLTTVGKRYAEIVGGNSEATITMFFGVFFLIFQTTQVWGNLISSLVLSTDKVDIDPNDPNLKFCGRNFCPEESGDSSDDDGISDTKLYTMSSIYLVCALLASVIVYFFVDPLSKFKIKDNAKDSSTKPSSKKLLIATLKHMENPYQILIIPLTIWSGVEQAFIGADFTAAYISCGYGVYMVGYIMILYGACDSIVSFGFTPLVKYVGRVPTFIVGALANTAMIVILLTWDPKPDENLHFYYIVAAFWGVGDAIWQTQINALYGVLFPGEAEAAYSNYRLWESVGFIIAYVCSTLICVNAKIYILIGFLSVGMIGYITIEVLEYRKNNKNKYSVDDLNIPS